MTATGGTEPGLASLARTRHGLPACAGGTDTESSILISADFDLVMVSRSIEKLYGRPMQEFLGHKCYRQFEHRNTVCPHCPGVVAMRTGKPCDAVTEGIRENGPHFTCRVRAYPVQGPRRTSAGFLEVIEDVSDRTGSEEIARFDLDLLKALGTASHIRRALRLGLEYGLQVEGIDSGCVFLTNLTTQSRELVAQVGFSSEVLNTLAFAETEPRTLAASNGLKMILALPILYGGQLAATMFLASTVASALTSTARALCEGLAVLLSTTIARINAEQRRGDAVADLDAFIRLAPLPAWCLDNQARVTIWNDAAEAAFGWRASEVFQRFPPFVPEGIEERFAALLQPHPPTGRPVVIDLCCIKRDGRPIDIRMFAAPCRDALGNSSKTLVMAQTLLGSGLAPTSGEQLDKSEVSAWSDTQELDQESFGDALQAGPELARILRSIAAQISEAPKPDDQEVVALTCSAIEAGGGSVSIECPPGGGVALHLHIPHDSACTDRVPLRVLAIQTDERGRDDLRLALEESLVMLTLCMCGEEGIQLAQEATKAGLPPDVVVVDLVMRDATSGLDVAAKLRKIAPGARMILTGDSSILGYERFGFVAALSRPYSLEAVNAAMSTAIGRELECGSRAAHVARPYSP